MLKDYRIITIIPARGGSKSIPKKNIRLLHGLPLVAYSIKYSLKSKIVDRTIVSTNDSEIAEISKKYGAEVPFLRPKKFAQDTAQDFPVINHAAYWFKKNEKYIPEFFILLRPTSPFRPKGLIEKGISLLINHNKADSVRSVALCDEHPYRMWKIKGNYMHSIIDKKIKEPYNIPRQQLPKIYYQTGDLEIMRSSTIFEKHSVSGDNIIPLIINKEDMVDIDTTKDFEKAKNKIKSKK